MQHRGNAEQETEIADAIDEERLQFAKIAVGRVYQNPISK